MTKTNFSGYSSVVILDEGLFNSQNIINADVHAINCINWLQSGN